MIVSELIEILERASPTSIVELQVYGHTYHSEHNRRSHGPVEITEDAGVVRIAASPNRNRPPDDILLGRM